MVAATNAVAAVSGAFDVNIVSQRLPSFRNIRATFNPLLSECQFELRALKPDWREFVLRVVRYTTIRNKTIEACLRGPRNSVGEFKSNGRQSLRNPRPRLGEYL